MKHMEKFVSTLQGFTGTIRRFPVTIFFFFISAVYTAININTNNTDNFYEIIFSLIFGAAIFMVLQLFYERFIGSPIIRIIFYCMAVLGTLIYYLVVTYAVQEFTTEILIIRTIVLFFILLIAFIWIPSIKSKIGFSESFMAVFKGFFTVAFYAGVMFLGVAIILLTTDMLLANVDNKAYLHAINIILFIYAPLHFLSLIPIYPGYPGKGKGIDEVIESGIEEAIGSDKNELNLRLKKAIEPSKFLEGLISFIIIPITAVFTIILLLYIIINITGDFWKDNLLEPLLVTYSITVITVYLLASVVKGKFAKYFILILPKVLIPVVLLQTIASIVKIRELGITAGRYYVILFGIFATISALIFSIWPNKKTNVIAPILIILSLLSIIPPTDAFLISKKNQIDRLTKVLKENDMLMGDKIIPNTNVSHEDREIIVDTIEYLNRMNYTKDISFLKAYNRSLDFEGTFGFSMYGSVTWDPVIYGLYLPKGIPLDVSDFDVLLEVELYGQQEEETSSISLWEDSGYSLIHLPKNGIGNLILRNAEGQELIRYPLDNIYDRFKDRTDKTGDLSPDDARFIVETDNAVLCIITKSINYEVWNYGGSYQNISAYIMIKLK